MASLNILFEVRPYMPGAGRSTIRLASSSADATGTQLDGLQWEPLIVSGPEYSFKYTSDQNGQLVEGSADLGTIQFRIGDFYDNEIWTTYDWNNASCRVWIGELGSPFASYRKLFEATTSGIQREGVTATVALRSLTGRLNRPLLNAVYAGTGGGEGPVGMKGAVKPITIGHCLSIEPVIVDAAKWIYQVHGYGPVQDIAAVYDFAQALAAPIATVGTYNELAALTLKPGEWAKCNALGMFRLGGASDKKITADVQGGIFYGQYPDTVADIVPALLRKAEFSASEIGSFAALANKGWSFYSKEPVDVGTVCRKAVLDAGGYLISDNQGVWQVGNAFAPKAAKPLLADGSAEPSVGAILERNVADPLWQVEVGYNPCWGVHSASDISPKLLELAGSIAEQDAALELVRETADLAKATAEAAEIEIDNMGADGILDRSEKIDNQRLLEEAAAERSTIASKIGIYNAATEWNAYVAAHEALKAYLAPLLADITVNSPIDRAAFKSRWATYREKHQAVWNAMAGDARTVSTWAGTSGAGKPQDNATVGAKAGLNLLDQNGAAIVTLEDGATKGAPVGTDVGGKPVIDVISDLGKIAPIEVAQVEAGRAILNAQLLAEQRRQRYEDITHVSGLPLGPVVARIDQERVQGDKAITDTVSLIGQKRADGQAFILNGSTVEIEPGKSLVSRLSELSSLTTADVSSAVSARISSYDEVLTSRTGAIARQVDGLEAKIIAPGGPIAAAINSYDRTTVDPADPTTKTVAESVRTLRSTVGGQSSEIAFILRALNGNEATAQLVLTANGKVSGLRLQGSTRSIAFDVKKFSIEDPDTGKSYFVADANDGGKVKMYDVEVDRIKAGSVDSPSLAIAATSRSSFATLSSDVACPYNTTADVISFVFDKVDADSVLKVQMFAQADHADDLIFTGEIVVDGNVAQTARVRMPFDNSNSRGSVPITPFAFVSGIAPGSHTVTFRLRSLDTEGPTYVRAGSTLEVTELRRAAAAVVQTNTVVNGSGGGGGGGEVLE